MEQIHVTKESFTVELGQKIIFFKLAEGGAMGKPGVNMAHKPEHLGRRS